MLNQTESFIFFSLLIIGMIIISFKVIKGQKKFGLKYNLHSFKRIINGQGLGIKKSDKEEFQVFIGTLMKQFIVMAVICITVMVVIIAVFHI